MGNKFLSILLFLSCALFFSFWWIQENDPPKVKIISPIENVKLEWNTIISYNISVSDKEDGASEYDEINGSEVVLTVTYFSDSSDIRKYVNETVSSRSKMLSKMASSNCLTCHKAKNKLIGPSFEEIVNRYNPTKENKEYLAQKISQGSTGVWSDEIMPAQTEMKKEDVILILNWIFKNAQDPNFTFYTGVEGAFKTGERPKDKHNKAAYVLHAQYTDHGLNGSTGKSKKGTHSIVLKVE